jgi:hypothetical protein
MSRQVKKHGRKSRTLADPKAIEEALWQKRVRQAWGEWLNEYPWDFFCTLTFRQRVATCEATKEGQLWIRRIGQRSAGKVYYHGVLEKSRRRRCHLHFLIQTKGRAGEAAIRNVWRSGLSDVQVYDPERGACWYITKGVNQYPDHVEPLLTKLPPS